jgi:lysozyme
MSARRGAGGGGPPLRLLRRVDRHGNLPVLERGRAASGGGDAMTTRETLVAQLVEHEGLRLKPYRCPAGKLTIGVGRNLDDVGITEAEARTLLHHDLARAEAALLALYPWVITVDPVRYCVLVNMLLNVGATAFTRFVLMMAAVKRGDFETAAAEMTASRWAQQVGRRATELAAQMRTGAWQR